jgi:hypothetical protein
METAPLTLVHEDHKVGWICALPVEMAAAVAMLDEHHDKLPQNSTDHNTYRLGRIGGRTMSPSLVCPPDQPELPLRQW